MRFASGPTAFVLDINVFGGLGAVRSLAREGVPVIGIAPDSSRFGFATRYGTAKQCPNPVTQPEDLLRFLLHEGRRLTEPGILLPASDEFVLFLWRYQDELRERFRFNTAPPEIMEAGVNKRKQYELAERCGVPYPTTFYPETMDEVRQIEDRLDYPVFIKPCYSHLWRARFPNRGKGIEISSPQALVDAFEEILRTDLQVMVQEIIPGPDSQHFNVRAYVGESGDILAEFVSRKLRQWPVQFGVGTMAESITDPTLLALGLRYFRETGFRGFGYVEFKRDSRDGQPKMIELNARFSAQIIHSTDCGVNFPLIQYLDLAGRSPAPQTTYRTGVRWLSAVGDLRSGWAHMRAGQLSPWGWARSWAGARSFAVFAWDDPKPFLRYALGLRSEKHRRPLASEQAARRAAGQATTTVP
jgi:predicted ATP-grasp superfamily ATP-dependent carboligase